MKNTATLFATLTFLNLFGLWSTQTCPAQEHHKHELPAIDWSSFMARHDMVWTKVPKRWQEAPFFGNGMVGLMLFQEISNRKNAYSTADKNVLSLHVGRGDYYDQRPPLDGQHHTWLYRGRLPIGFFRIKSKGDVTGVDWKLELWKARLVGTVTTTEGAYEIEGKVHATYDSFRWSVKPLGGEQVEFQWQPQKAEVYVRTLALKHAEQANKSGRKLSSFDKKYSSTPYPAAPEISTTEESGAFFSQQRLHGDTGEQVTAWQVVDGDEGEKTLLATVEFSTEVGKAFAAARENLSRSVRELASGDYDQTHEAWWRDYYQRSFLSVSDDFWEQFYWIQIYKYGCATRADGMLIDTYGPWNQPGIHPMVWGDLNVQLDYWLPVVANRLEVGSSLLNKMDAGLQNMIANVPERWQDDCLSTGTIWPNDFRSPAHAIPADHVTWLLHNYWQFCCYAGDDQRMRDGLFPLLKRANATYLRYLEEQPLDLGDGKRHFKRTWSPESVTGQDINYTIALARWSSKTLLEINQQHQLNDPKAAQWQKLLDELVGYQVDENGLMLGREHPFNEGHRHYSHLLAYFPLYDLTLEKNRELIKKSVDHWIYLSEYGGRKLGKARPITSYSCTGAASMYAGLGEGERCLEFLQKFTFMRVYSTTLYAEGDEQLIETPLSAASTMQDMLLVSWGGRIRVMPGVPDAWSDVQFRSLLCEGGAEVSADRTAGKLTYVRIDSPKTARTIEFTMPMDEPAFALLVGGVAKPLELQPDADGNFKVELPADGSLVAKAPAADAIPHQPVKSAGEEKNIFGDNGRYEKVRGKFKYQYEFK